MSMASIVAAQKKELLQSGGTYNGPVTPTFTVSTVKTWTLRYEKTELNNTPGSIPHTVCKRALEPRLARATPGVRVSRVRCCVA